ncbi:NAD(P)-dependent oxidoreductase [Chitinasiproducens palmae]|uniref:3-hydroxyisobutyrate dehydrogenase n=1 Tax=Chitinasiproducens palmae TaxID=1770053 RepID=A0A1H2PNZ1_9BURK|nr:NAD(P)-dependent oxidoreductase [Chitinasiproducens palmae]SDV47965.1 3-hydroxyisobutyrate dehydrogenase [Chitinasiproducens palmae]
MNTTGKVGVIGLGNMGRGMATSLARAGHSVLGYDAAPGVAAALADQGVGAADSIAALLAEVDCVILSLPTSAVVEQVVFGADGVARQARPGLLVIDTTTAEPASTRRVAAALAEAGIAFIDGPVSGGPKGAATATMTMVLGGSSEDVARAEPVLAAISAKRVHVGPVGAGHVTKIINNMLTGIHLLAASEAVRVAQANGVDPEKLVDALNGGSGRNSATLTNYPTWIFNDRFDSGFTMKLMRKDVRLAEALLDGAQVHAPVAQTAARLWAASEATLGDGEDFNRIVQFVPPRD